MAGLCRSSTEQVLEESSGQHMLLVTEQRGSHMQAARPLVHLWVKDLKTKKASSNFAEASLAHAAHALTTGAGFGET